VDSLCHPWVTTTNPSYRFLILETSATALCGTTGRKVCCSTLTMHGPFWGNERGNESNVPGLWVLTSLIWNLLLVGAHWMSAVVFTPPKDAEDVEDRSPSVSSPNPELQKGILHRSFESRIDLRGTLCRHEFVLPSNYVLDVGQMDHLQSQIGLLWYRFFCAKIPLWFAVHVSSSGFAKCKWWTRQD